jgi:ABC-type lipoprotein export system ATPase subunit
LDLQLDHVRPPNIAPERAAASQVWDADLRLPAGARVHVHAPSGSGKTTFIHLLYGLRRTYGGRYALGGRDTAAFAQADWSRLRADGLSVVFQDLRLFPAATGWENIRLNGELAPAGGPADWRAMAERLGVGSMLDRPVHTLSQGERQRIALVRALSQRFAWLLLDEPFSHLDEANIALARELIVERAEAEGAGLILAGLGFEYHVPNEIELAL